MKPNEQVDLLLQIKLSIDKLLDAYLHQIMELALLKGEVSQTLKQLTDKG